MSNVTRNIPIQRLWELYDFDFIKGKLISKTTGKHVKGFPNKQGYLRITVWYDGRPIQRQYSRVVWAWFNGQWPQCQVDHINRNLADNNIWNLRDVTSRVNNQNRSNFKGGYYNKQSKKWVAQAYINKKVTCLGKFATLEESATAYWSTIQGVGP
jgi:hypothetical protein